MLVLTKKVLLKVVRILGIVLVLTQIDEVALVKGCIVLNAVYQFFQIELAITCDLFSLLDLLWLRFCYGVRKLYLL